jgi:limonene-1,2-epoxide hydrolase
MNDKKYGSRVPDEGVDPARRHWLAAGSLLLAGCATTGPAAAPEATPPSALERANEDLVNRFCAAWSTRDVEQLVPFLADDLVYQVFEGRPDILGVAQFRREMEPFLRKLERVEWEILRSRAIGPLVINERIDHFVAPAGGRSQHFPIAGLFVVKDAKIRLWRDYTLPAEARTRPG